MGFRMWTALSGLGLRGSSFLCIGSILSPSHQQDACWHLQLPIFLSPAVQTEDWTWVLTSPHWERSLQMQGSEYTDWPDLGCVPAPRPTLLDVALGRGEKFSSQKLGEYMLVNRNRRRSRRHTDRMMSVPSPTQFFQEEFKCFWTNLTA